MAAPNENSNALKWTQDRVNKLLDDLDGLIEEKGIIYLGQALIMQKTTTKQWNRIKAMYAGDEELMHRMDFIEEALVSKMVVGGINGTLKGNVVQFVLKTKHGFKEPEKAEQKKGKEESAEIDEAMIDAIEKEVGPLSAKFAYSKESREIIRLLAGSTKRQMQEGGYFYENGAITGPHNFIRVSEDFMFPV